MTKQSFPTSLHLNCWGPLWEIPPMTRSWGEDLTLEAVQDPIRDEVMRKRPDMQGRSGHKGPSRLAPASSAPCILSPFLLLLLFTLLQILVLPAKSSPVPLSVNEDQLKTLTNKFPGCQYPMTGPGMKEMLQFKPFCWHSGLFDKCVLSLQKNAHDYSKHPTHSTLTKETIKHRSFHGVKKAPQIK